MFLTSLFISPVLDMDAEYMQNVLCIMNIINFQNNPALCLKLGNCNRLKPQDTFGICQKLKDIIIFCQCMIL